MHENYEDLGNEFRYYSVKGMVEKTLQEMQKSMVFSKIGDKAKNLNNIYDTAKKALEIAFAFNNVELNQTIIDLQRQALDMEKEKIELTKEVESLKEELGKRKIIFSDNDKRWYAETDVDHKEPPICSGCYDTTRKIIHLTKAPLSSRKDGLDVKCPVCEHES